MPRICPDPGCDEVMEYARPQAAIGRYYCPVHGAPGSPGWTGHPSLGP